MVGIGAAGLVNPDTGLALTANICADGKPFPSDIEAAAGQTIPYINDCRALALSAAVFGAGRGHHRVMSLILGPGVGGGVAVDGVIAVDRGGILVLYSAQTFGKPDAVEVLGVDVADRRVPAAKSVKIIAHRMGDLAREKWERICVGSNACSAGPPLHPM